MTLSLVSAGTPPSQPWQQVRDDYDSLGRAVAQGDMQTAQKAYAAIQQDRQNGPQFPASSAVSQDFGALGAALRSGDLDGARQAFSSLQAGFQDLRRQDLRRARDGADAASASFPAKTVASEVTTIDADGVRTVTATYTDGTASSEIPLHPSPAMSLSPLAALLSAQERQALLQPAR